MLPPTNITLIFKPICYFGAGKAVWDNNIEIAISLIARYE